MNTKTILRSLLIMLSISVMMSCNTSTKTATDTDNSTSTSASQTPGNYTSKMTKPDKKKYYDNNNNVVYEIKYKPDGFKLRTSSSQLLWKVKLYDDKVKISDNEENLNPYEIKMGGTYDAKLVKDDAVLARTSYDLESKTQSIASETDDQPDFYEGSYSISFLVNRISEISADQKEILISELKAKGY